RGHLCGFQWPERLRRPGLPLPAKSLARSRELRLRPLWEPGRRRRCHLRRRTECVLGKRRAGTDWRSPHGLQRVASLPTGRNLRWRMAFPRARVRDDADASVIGEYFATHLDDSGLSDEVDRVEPRKERNAIETVQ